MARPTDYTLELTERICALLAEGKSLRTICKADGLPECATIFRWLRIYPTFCEQYTRAKQESADAMAEDMQDIADDGSNDWMQANDPNNPGWLVNKEHINRSRLRIETRKWLASKLKPKKYGEKLELSGDPQAPIAPGFVMILKDDIPLSQK